MSKQTTIRILSTKGLVALFIFSLCGTTTSFTVEKPSSRLQENAKVAVKNLADENPDYLDALVPENPSVASNSIPISAVPPEVLNTSLYWIRKVVREEWLPKNLKNVISASKDLRLREDRRDARFGLVLPCWVADYIVSHYMVWEHTVYIQENDISVSARIHFPETVGIPDNPKIFVRECIKKFINISGEELESLSYDLQRRGNLIHGIVGKESTSTLVDGGQIKCPNWWWHRMTICTDGSFFFVSVPERDGKPFNPQANLGLPDRF